MKHVYTFLLATGFLLTAPALNAQSQLINENFNTAFPSAWPQAPAASWSLSPNLGSSGSGCIMIEDLSSNGPTLSISTTTLNLNAVTNLTVSFKLAVVGNNFMPPDLALSYDAGAGLNFLARWGAGLTVPTTYSIANTDYDYDYLPPLDAEHVIFISCTHTISAISGSAVRFVFSAEPYNGGYVLIDDVLITGKPVSTVGIQENSSASLALFPNPSLNRIFFLEGQGVKSIRLSDNSGKNLPVQYTRINTDNTELDLRNFSKGVYYLHVVTEKEEVLVKKLVLE